MEISHHQNPVVGVVLAIRGIDQSMSRLRIEIPPKIVSQLVKNLFIRAVNTCLTLKLKPYIITSDPRVENLMKEQNVKTFLDEGISLNHALKSALQQYSTNKRVLFIMPDLPGLTVHSLEKLLYFSKIFENIIVPSIDGGTSALVCGVDTLCEGLFGEGSSDKFTKFMKKRNKAIARVRIHELVRDLDNLNDYHFWLKHTNLFTDNILV